MRLFNRFALFFFPILLASHLGCASTAKPEGTEKYIDDSAERGRE